MDDSCFVGKGARVRVHFFQANPGAALTGNQVKFSCALVDFTGVIRHFRGDKPVEPTVIKAYIDPDPGETYTGPRYRPEGCRCVGEHVEIDPKHIIELLSPV